MKLNFLFRLIFLILLFVSPFTFSDLLIRNATIHTASSEGTLMGYDILIKGKKIVRIQKNIINNTKVTELDAEGKFISPGIISPNSQIGILEIELVPETRDDQTDIYSAGFTIDSAFNPFSTLIPHNRSAGVTMTISSPSSGDVFIGLSSAFLLNGSLENSLIKSSMAMIAEISSGEDSRASKILFLKDALIMASNFDIDNIEASSAQLPSNYYLAIRDIEALRRVMNKSIPLIVKADRASDILEMIDLSKKLDFRLVIMGGKEAWMVADEIASNKVPLIIQPIDNIPSSFNSLGARLDNASILSKSGVQLIFAAHEWSSHNSYLSRQGAGIAVSYGLPWEEALRAITANIAEVFNLEKRGSLKEGNYADIVLWDGDPLEVTSFAEKIYIEGVEFSNKSRASKLKERYLN
tara:strand:- start:16703 stop:17932 length:1230 start_codon:yes stop_codon:yes gene_type:complete